MVPRRLKPCPGLVDGWVMKHGTLLVTLCAALFALTACGPSASAKVEGRYTLAGDAFVEAAVKSLRDSNRIPAGAEGLAEAQLRAMVLMLELKPAGEFVVKMTVQNKHKIYTGTWTRASDQIVLTQTHDGDKPKTDSMEGKIDGDLLRLTHMEQGVSFPYILQREGSPAAPGR